MALHTFTKRRLERFDLELPAKMRVVGETTKSSEYLELQTTDISSGGAFFYTDKKVPVGTEVKIDFFLSLEELKKMSGKHVKINISGSVVRSDGQGMAVSFSDRYEITPMSISGQKVKKPRRLSSSRG